MIDSLELVMNLESPLVFIRLPDLLKMTGLCRSTVYNLMNPKSKYFDPSFPNSVGLTPNGRSKAWSRAEVEAWMLGRLDAR